MGPMNCSYTAVKNEIKVIEGDIDIVNEKGNRLYFIKAPGSYSLHFKKLVFTKDIEYFWGEIGVTLQVPIIKGLQDVLKNVIMRTRCNQDLFLLKRSIFPEETACLYSIPCYIPVTSKTSEQMPELPSILPELARGIEEKFALDCNKIASNIYEFSHIINLPSRRELEAQVNKKVRDWTVKFVNVLTKKQCFPFVEVVLLRYPKSRTILNIPELNSAEKPAIKQDEWFVKSAECRCCWDDRDASCHGVLSFLYCNKEECKNNWAKRCLHHIAHIVACYKVEFNYRTTTSFADVIQFLKENNYPNQESVTVSLLKIHFVLQTQLLENTDNALPLAERCVAKMSQKVTHLRRYCIIFWNDKPYCSHCPDVCQS
ncbi:unnamed protein product [Onchocerca ochengi]|uniref:DUF3794 domain-containing protein n=1 Tax=Onchocerca ochengi TaxID=42157 RepID=A0A182EA48_ONCOC|nr:unnamed protein product [Onchocerca ochengi]